MVTQIKQYHDMQHGVILICANKADLVYEVVASERERRAKADLVGALFVPTSAQTDRNVDFAFLTATERIVEIRKIKSEDKRTRTLDRIRIAARMQQKFDLATRHQIANCCTSS
jgi:hypothetical protein